VSLSSTEKDWVLFLSILLPLDKRSPVYLCQPSFWLGGLSNSRGVCFAASGKPFISPSAPSTLIHNARRSAGVAGKDDDPQGSRGVTVSNVM